MIIVTAAKSRKRCAVVTNDGRSHDLGDCSLPSIIFTHAMGGTPLALRNLIGVIAMNSLP